VRTTSIARRYARATFEVAQEQNAATEWQSFLDELAALALDRSLLGALENPNISDEQKLKALRGAFQSLPEPLANLLRLLIQRHRLGTLPGIAAAFAQFVDEAEGRTEAEVVSARLLDDSELKAVEEHLTKHTGKTVRLRKSVDPALIGGVVLRIGDEVIDASISTRLDRLRQRLT
jgi:F-type H+-transporting ATPase subunit delta